MTRRKRRNKKVKYVKKKRRKLFRAGEDARNARAHERAREREREREKERLFSSGKARGCLCRNTREGEEREREREKKSGKFEKRKAMPEKKTRVQKKKREVVGNIYEDCPNGCRGKEEGDEEERASDGDEMDANVVERLFRACERVCSDSSVGTPATAPLTTSSSSSSFATRRREQRERTREIYERLKPHLERVTARDVGLVWKREHYEDEDTSGDDTDEDEEEEKEEEEFARDPLKSLFANMFKRTKKKRESKRSSPFSALTNAFQAGRKKSPAVHSQRIYACEDFQICTFIIPEGMEIPLHNHPEMTVLSKCLYGAARVQTYKWTDGMYENASARKPRACDLVSDIVIDASNGGIQVCSPEENIHRIVAITDVAILDVFVPPYDVDGERDCTYYELKREKSKEDIEIEPEQRVPALVEIEDSAFECFAMEYRGLKIFGNR